MRFVQLSHNTPFQELKRVALFPFSPNPGSEEGKDDRKVPHVFSVHQQETEGARERKGKAVRGGGIERATGTEPP